MKKTIVKSILLVATVVVATNNAYVGPVAYDEGDKLDKRFGAIATPTNWLIDRQGHIVVESSDRALSKNCQTSDDRIEHFPEAASTGRSLRMFRDDI